MYIAHNYIWTGPYIYADLINIEAGNNYWKDFKKIKEIQI